VGWEKTPPLPEEVFLYVVLIPLGTTQIMRPNQTVHARHTGAKGPEVGSASSPLLSSILNRDYTLQGPAQRRSKAFLALWHSPFSSQGRPALYLIDPRHKCFSHSKHNGNYLPM
jgi:hypothetical protein